MLSLQIGIKSLINWCSSRTKPVCQLQTVTMKYQGTFSFTFVVPKQQLYKRKLQNWSEAVGSPHEVRPPDRELRPLEQSPVLGAGGLGGVLKL